MSVGKKGAKGKGTRIERKGVKELNACFKRLDSPLKAVRVPGSGSFANRGICTDEALVGDIRILKDNGDCVEKIEVKAADPNRKSGPITIAFFRRLLNEGRRIVMCRHDRGTFLVAVVAEAELWRAHDWTPKLKDNPRGMTIEDVQGAIEDLGLMSTWLGWGGVYFGSIKLLAGALHEAYGQE